MNKPSVNWALASGLPASIHLASKSPRRLELLRSLGLKVEVFLAKQGAEAEALEAPFEMEPPVSYVLRVTQLKLDAAVQALRIKNTGGMVLASDTTVALGNRILGKPESPAQARTMLEELSGNIHQVHTAVAVANLDSRQHGIDIHTADVQFDQLPPSFIQAYIDSLEPYDKAGGYGIQGIIGQYVTRINGSHSGIMGLPLFETARLIRKYK